MLNTEYLCKNKYGKDFVVKYDVNSFDVSRRIFMQSKELKYIISGWYWEGYNVLVYNINQHS